MASKRQFDNRMCPLLRIEVDLQCNTRCLNAQQKATCSDGSLRTMWNTCSDSEILRRLRISHLEERCSKALASSFELSIEAGGARLKVTKDNNNIVQHDLLTEASTREERKTKGKRYCMCITREQRETKRKRSRRNA